MKKSKLRVYMDDSETTIDMPVPNSESHADFVHRCLTMETMTAAFPDDDERLEQCQECWRKNNEDDDPEEDDEDDENDDDKNDKRDNSLRIVRLRRFDVDDKDMELIRKCAGNENLQPDQIFHFRDFIIAKSGDTKNHVSIARTAIAAAVAAWVGKAILYAGRNERDHEHKASSQVGRIYTTYTKEVDGQLVLFGRGYGIRTEGNADLFAEIDGAVKREMSCSYAPLKSSCSRCNADMTNADNCPNGHRIGVDGCMAVDESMEPDHIAYVGRPGIEGAGMVVNNAARQSLKRVFTELDASTEKEAKATIRKLRMLADDGKEFRDWAKASFIKFYSLNHPQESPKQVAKLANKLSVREMLSIGKINRSEFMSVMPGRQMSVQTPTEPETESPQERLSMKEIQAAMTAKKEIK